MMQPELHGQPEDGLYVNNPSAILAQNMSHFGYRHDALTGNALRYTSYSTQCRHLRSTPEAYGVTISQKPLYFQWVLMSCLGSGRAVKSMRLGLVPTWGTNLAGTLRSSAAGSY